MFRSWFGMNTDRLFANLRTEIRRIVPSEIDITAIEFEGPTVVVYTKDFDKFAENVNITKQLANGLKKRVDIPSEAWACHPRPARRSAG